MTHSIWDWKGWCKDKTIQYITLRVKHTICFSFSKHQLFKLFKLYHFWFRPSNNSINYLLCSILHVRRLIYSVIVKTHKYGTWHALKRDAHVWKIGYLFFLLKHENKITFFSKEHLGIIWIMIVFFRNWSMFTWNCNSFHTNKILFQLR